MQGKNRQKILEWCDQCVLCGLCLPHCPTYQIERNESESPRGRIVLIQALMRGSLDQNSSDWRTLEHCLLCRACEAVCPSQVPFGEIMALTRDALKPGRSKVVGQLMDAVADPGQMQGMLSKLRLYQRSGVQRLVRGSGLLRGELKAAEGMLRFASGETFAGDYPAPSASRGVVQLFTGCMGEHFDRQTVEDAILLLNRLGYGVKIAHPARCCGAIHHHNGEVAKGRALRSQAIDQLTNSNADLVVGLAGSCIARLNEDRGDEGPLTVIEVTDFIAANLDRLADSLAHIKMRVALHQPCTSKNLLKNFDKTIALLNQLPGLEILMLPTYGCCGASGTHMVSDAEHASMFLDEGVRWLAAERPELIVSQNMGCMLHLSAEMARQNRAIEVIHPISLLLKFMADQ